MKISINRKDQMTNIHNMFPELIIPTVEDNNTILSIDDDIVTDSMADVKIEPLHYNRNHANPSSFIMSKQGDRDVQLIDNIYAVDDSDLSSLVPFLPVTNGIEHQCLIPRVTDSEKHVFRLEVEGGIIKKSKPTRNLNQYKMHEPCLDIM